MASDEKPAEGASTAFTFKKFMGNVASTSKLFATKAMDSNNNTTKPVKTVKELEDQVEILQLQKADLRQLVQERTYELDNLKKLDTEHQKLRKRWKENEEKSSNEVANISAYSDEIKNELTGLKNQNAVLQSKQTQNDLKKNELTLKLSDIQQENEKNKKIIERKNQEKKMLVSEVLKLRNEKQELIQLYKAEINKLNKNNTNNISHLKELNQQQMQSKEMEHLSHHNALKHKYEELNILYTNYKQNMKDKIINIDSTTNAFDAMIINSNIGNLSQEECNKILDNIINSIESMEKENENYHKTLNINTSRSDIKENGDGIHGHGREIKTKNNEMVLNQIESRMLKSLREKGLLQRSTNELMFQLQELQKQHEQEIKVKDEAIQQYELRAKIKFFKKKQSNT